MEVECCPVPDLRCTKFGTTSAGPPPGKAFCRFARRLFKKYSRLLKAAFAYWSMQNRSPLPACLDAGHQRFPGRVIGARIVPNQLHRKRRSIGPLMALCLGTPCAARLSNGPSGDSDKIQRNQAVRRNEDLKRPCRASFLCGAPAERNPRLSIWFPVES
jgi:hypothetical protein